VKALGDIEKLKLYGQDFDNGLKSVLLEVNKKYGDILFEELINRIELTISLFQDEMGSIRTEIDNSYTEIPRISEIVNIQEKHISDDSSSDDIPEWEYRLNNN